MNHIPSYLEHAVVERGDARDELLLCLVQALQEQTEVQERIAEALEAIAAREHPMAEAEQATRGGLEEAAGLLRRMRGGASQGPGAGHGDLRRAGGGR